MAHYASFPGNLASYNSSSTPPVIRASNTTTPLTSFASALIPRRRRRRGRDAFAVFVDVYIAKHKYSLPTPKAEVRLIARPIWDGLPKEEQIFYETLARREREYYEHDNAAPALQRRVSAQGDGSRNSRGRQMAAHSLSVVDRDLPQWLVAQGMDTQDVYYAPAITPTTASGIPPIQHPDSFMMDVNIDAVPHNTLGQDMIHSQHGQATQGVRANRQRQASFFIPAVATVPSASDSQNYNTVPYYRDTSGQIFAVMNQPAMPQYFSSAPVVAPVAHHPNPATVSFTPYQLDGNIHNHNSGWAEPSTTYTSASSSVEVVSSSRAGGSTYGGGSSPRYQHPAENT
ncbi:hypothetical protein F5146DRAFT_708287 [Armillaria mellea]|nr:hypothetical protein F5146DRAFT_708287 [Armillaria mellea]